MSERLVFELQAVDRATAPLKAVQGQLDRTARSVKQHSDAYNMASVSGRKWAMGALQQLGFQLGDFAVQVTNGTNKMQAFGQQAPQLLQIFGPLGAIAGAAVAIFSAFAVAQQKVSEGASDTSDAMTGLRKAIDDFKTSADLANSSAQDLQDQFGRLGERFRKDLEILANLGFQRAMSSLRSELSGIQVQFGDAFTSAIKLSKAIKDGEPPPGWIVDAVQNVMSEMNLTAQQVAELSDSIDAMQNATGLETIIATTEEFRDKLIEAYGSANNIPEPLSRVLGLLAAARAEAGRLAASLPFSGGKDDERGSQREGRRDIGALRSAEAVAARLAKMRSDVRSAAGGGGGGGGTEDAITRLRQQIALEEQLLGKTDAQRRVIQALGADYSKYSEDTVNGLVEQINRMDEFNKLAENQKQIAQTIKNSMSSAFMSMVDGTKSVKDAFRDMARSIIAKLFDILVVQRLVNGIMGFVGKAFPALTPAIAGAKAMGGPVTGGQAYMVGERGPEMIIPSRNARVIPNNQLGGGGVTVVQNINVSTGVQQTVRAEIKSLMPQIADSAKAAVLDAKRRGGAYGGAFA